MPLNDTEVFSLYFMLCVFQAMREGRHQGGQFRKRKRIKVMISTEHFITQKIKHIGKKRATESGGGLVPHFSKHVTLNNSFLDANRYYNQKKDRTRNQ